MAERSQAARLAFHDVSAGYGETVVLDGVSLALGDGDTLAILGRNGVGKTTLLASVLGHTKLHAGRIEIAGAPVSDLAVFQRARRGVGYVPQEREIFPSLTVHENLTVSIRAKDGPRRWPIERIYELFPSLAARRQNWGNQLSGGEQQMLAIGRALVNDPDLLLMDEPLEGLAPVIVDGLIAAFQQLRRDEGMAIMLVEQHARLALEFAQRAIVLDRGRIVFEGESCGLRDDPARLAGLIGLSG